MCIRDSTGDVSEAAQVAEAFPSAPDGTLLRQVDEGTLEASYPEGGNSLGDNSAYFQEPDAPHEVIQGAEGLNWYAMTPAAAAPEFEPETPAPSGGGLSPSAQYNAALFGQFMPGFDQPVVSVDSSRSADGILEVRDVYKRQPSKRWMRPIPTLRSPAPGSWCRMPTALLARKSSPEVMEL